MVLLESLKDSYVINGDGSMMSTAQIHSPSQKNDYLAYSASAVVAGKLHIFGGYKTTANPGDKPSQKESLQLSNNLILFEDRAT